MLRAPLPSILVKTAPEPRAMSIAVFLALRGGFSDELKSRWNRVNFCTLEVMRMRIALGDFLFYKRRKDNESYLQRRRSKRVPS